MFMYLALTDCSSAVCESVMGEVGVSVSLFFSAIPVISFSADSGAFTLKREKTNTGHSRMKREKKHCKVKTGCIANVLMSLLLISAT